MVVQSVQLQQPALPELVGAPELGITSQLGGASEVGETLESRSLDGLSNRTSPPQRSKEK